MKVCVISFVECWRDPSGQWMANGGFPRQMNAIASLFDEMDLLLVAGKPRAGGHALPAKARVVPLRSPYGADSRRKLSVLFNLPVYTSVMLRHLLKADVVHVPLPGDLPLLGMALALISRKRLLARYGGSWSANTQTTLMNRVTRASMRAFAGGLNVMLATGSGRERPAPNMDWIFSTAVSESELSAIQPDLNRGIGSPAKLVYCGRLSPEKGVPVLLRALAALQGRQFRPMPELTLMGDGPDRTHLERMVRDLKLESNVRFDGYLDRAGLSRRFLEADLCVQPSLSEGFSKAWLDAMAHGVPVVASEVGAAADVIGRTNARGWLVKPGDAGQLASTLHMILDTPREWPALRQRCRQYAETLTLENWQREIGRICSRRWNWTFAEGRLIG